MSTYAFEIDSNTGSREQTPITPFTDFSKEMAFYLANETNSDSLEREVGVSLKIGSEKIGGNLLCFLKSKS